MKKVILSVLSIMVLSEIVSASSGTSASSSLIKGLMYGDTNSIGAVLSPNPVQNPKAIPPKKKQKIFPRR